jgi:hypothetical protein
MYAKPKPEEPAKKPEPSDEVQEAADDPLFKWRLEQLMLLGVPVVDAIALADRADSPHQVRHLIRIGATVDVAVRIVL